MSTLDRLRRVHEVISEVERAAACFPDDRFVQANLASLRRDADDLESQWAKTVRVEQKDVVRYRLLPANAADYPVRSVTTSLLDFQELFSQIFDALKNGAKKRARLAADVLEDTQFNFAFSFTGSLGVAMSVDAPRLLIGEKFDASVDALMQIVELRGADDIRDLAKKLGQAVVRKAFDWSKVNLDAEYSVDLKWTTASGQLRGGMIDLETFRRLVEVIGRASEIETATVRTTGFLMGFDAKVRRFRFIDSKDAYTGVLSTQFPASAVWSINMVYEAEIEVERTTSYATQETKTAYTLKNLEPLLPQPLPV